MKSPQTKISELCGVASFFDRLFYQRLDGFDCFLSFLIAFWLTVVFGSIWTQAKKSDEKPLGFWLCRAHFHDSNQLLLLLIDLKLFSAFV
jgi:hypothetical protein